MHLLPAKLWIENFVYSFGKGKVEIDDTEGGPQELVRCLVLLVTAGS